MAWSERLPSGKYRGVYRDSFGKRRSAGTFTHKAKAERAAAAREELARKSLVKDPEAYRRPWGQWAEEWWPTRDVQPSTLRQDKGRWKNHLEPQWATVPIGSITRQDVKAWIAKLRKDGLGPETVKRCVHLFSASMSAAVDGEIVQANPASRIQMPGGALAQERYMTHEEFDILREQLPTTRDQLIADMLVNTGLRWGELAGLHWSRVNLELGKLRVVETWDESDGRMKAYPKGKRTRDVPLTPELEDALRDLAPRGATCGVEHATGRCPGPLVLTTEGGAPLRNSNWAYRVWTPSVEAAGIGHVRIHDCRHSYASWLLQNGVSLAEVGRLLGHVSPTTTQRYAHLAQTDAGAILQALAAPRKPHARVS
ncbi:site-specific integrase [Aeromicrobium sp. 9AM]|uniref:tyrosine-type recombinase/integrase n=1 Tax=Aeromicrobium sp. 9AM TaxID=2653126 RepID=UPI0012EFCED2|nr:site-specific integrase [Aeromicrobium sp. 9AM]VXC06421.1 Site-specific recombinase XerD [Aeromicrobium sp. 9AM]